MHIALTEGVRNICRSLVAQASGPVWLVGGTVRDGLLDRPLHDIDIVVTGAAQPLAEHLAIAHQGTLVTLDADRDIQRVVLTPQLHFDIAALRANDLPGDLAARDFTANAIAAPLQADGSAGPLIDPLHGQAAIASGVVQACSAFAIDADPLRMLRAVRLAAQLQWRIDPPLEAQMRSAAPQITSIAAERIRDELLLILAAPPAAASLRYLDALGILGVLLPELLPLHGHTQPLMHFLDVWEHSLEAITAGEWLLAQLAGDQRLPATALTTTPDDPYPPDYFTLPTVVRLFPELALKLAWAPQILEHMHQPIGPFTRIALWKLALLWHDIAKPATRVDYPDGSVSFHHHQEQGSEIAERLAERLRLSRPACDYIASVVRAHMRPGQLMSQAEGTTARAAYRFFQSVGGGAIDTLLHSMADGMAASGPRLNPQRWESQQRWTDAMVSVHWDQPEERSALLFDGTLLMQKLGLKPGPQLGQLLAALREAQAVGEITSTAEALALARMLVA